MNKNVEILLEGKHVDLENMEIVNKKVKQAGLSRATIRTQKSHSTHFEVILQLYCKDLSNRVWSSELNLN